MQRSRPRPRRRVGVVAGLAFGDVAEERRVAAPRLGLLRARERLAARRRRRRAPCPRAAHASKPATASGHARACGRARSSQSSAVSYAMRSKHARIDLHRTADARAESRRRSPASYWSTVDLQPLGHHARRRCGRRRSRSGPRRARRACRGRAAPRCRGAGGRVVGELVLVAGDAGAGRRRSGRAPRPAST